MIINLKIEEQDYKLFSISNIFNIYLEIHYQDC
jgi:hypothetical protein